MGSLNLAAWSVLIGLSTVGANAWAFPADGDWVPLLQAGTGLSDPYGDGKNNGRDIVGTEDDPALFINMSNGRYHLRMRLADNPQLNATNLRSYGWGLLFITNGSFASYEYALMVDGIRGEIVLAENTSPSFIGDPADQAETVMPGFPVLLDFTAGTGNVRVSPAGTNIGGGANYFLDVWVDASLMLQGDLADGGPLYIIGGTSNNARSLSEDVAGCDDDANDCTLSDAASDLVMLDGSEPPPPLSVPDVAGDVSSGTAGGVGPNVLAGATRGDDPLDATSVTVIVVDDGGLSGVEVSDEGDVVVPSGTPAGSYVVQVKVCEVAIPGNCDEAEVTLNVGPGALLVIDDAFTITSGSAGGDTPSVLLNDTLDGAAPQEDALFARLHDAGGLAGVSVSDDGVITVPAGTAADVYVVRVEVCEALNPANCAVGEAAVTVGAAVIAGSDTAVDISSGAAGGDTTSIFGDVTLDGEPVDEDEVGAELLDDGGLDGATVNDEGQVNVPSGTPAGEYDLSIEVCELLNPSNCVTMVVTVNVGPGALDLTDDLLFVASGNEGGATASIFDNDRIDGEAAAPGSLTASLDNPEILPGVTLNEQGQFVVPPGTEGGSYVFDVTVCEALNPTNCDTAEASVTVGVAELLAEDVEAEVTSGAAGGEVDGVLSSVTLNGEPADLDDLDAVVSDDGGLDGLSLSEDGALVIPAGTPAGTYTVVIEVCDAVNPGNCVDVTVTLEVGAAELGVNDDVFAVDSGASGGQTASIFLNDTLDGELAEPGALSGELLDDGGVSGLVLEPDGSLTVPPGTPIGVFTVQVEVCEVLNPDSCLPGEVVLEVGPLGVIASADQFLIGSGRAGGTTSSVLDNDLLRGLPVVPTDVTVTLVSDGGLVGLSLDADGRLIVPSGTQAGSYTAVVEVCEVGGAQSCASAEALIEVGLPALSVGPLPDLIVDEDDGGASDPLSDFVMLDGGSISSGEVEVFVIDDGGLTDVEVGPDLEVIVPAGTAAGDYELELEVCEVLNPAHCVIVPLDVTVNPTPDVDTADSGALDTGSPNDTDIDTQEPPDPDDVATPDDTAAPDGRPRPGDLGSLVGRTGMYEGGQCGTVPGVGGLLALAGAALFRRRRRRDD